MHLELHTGDLAGAREFYSGLCDWRPERITVASGSYLALSMGGALGGGIVECAAGRPLWLPYVRWRTWPRPRTERASSAPPCAGAARGAVRVARRRCGAGAGELAFWQPKRPRA